MFKPIIMFDSIELSEIPIGAKAVAGYVNGTWPTYDRVVRDFPHANHLSIAVSALADADTLDIEKGDAVPSQALHWVRVQQRRGIKRPCIYCSLADAQSVLDLLSTIGIKRRNVRLWTAHYTDVPHICSPKCGFHLETNADATQYTNHGFNRNLDISLCRYNFFGNPIVKALPRWLRFGHI